MKKTPVVVLLALGIGKTTSSSFNRVVVECIRDQFTKH